MDYSLCDLPNSGENPVVYMDIGLRGESLGKIYIRLFRNVFPAGVENFVRIASGKTYKTTNKGIGQYKYIKEETRTYTGCTFFRHMYGNYIISGDIYNNDGSSAGTIYSDEPIPPCFGDYYYPHDRKGLVSLIPYQDQETGIMYYDSTFLITLDDVKPSNLLSELDATHVVIGEVYDGLNIIDKMNQMVLPYGGRRYPEFTILKADVYRQNNYSRRVRM